MRAPSVKTLVASFRDLDTKQAKLVRAFAKATDDPDALEELVEKVPATEAYVRSLHSSPYRSGIWRVTVAMHAINDIVGGYGVEGLGTGRSGDYAPPYEYVNFGDPYVTTLIYDRDKDRLFVGDWGSIVEREDPEGQWNGHRGNGRRGNGKRRKAPRGRKPTKRKAPARKRKPLPPPKSKSARRILAAGVRKDK